MQPKILTAKRSISSAATCNWQLVEERFPVSRYSSGGSRHGLMFRVRMRRKQLRTLDHSLRLVIVEPILTGLKAGNDGMSSGCIMFGCMLVRRTVAAPDVPTLRTAAQVKPPAVRRCQAFHTAIATGLRSGVDTAQTFFHFRFSSRGDCLQDNVKAPAGSFRYHLLLPLPGPQPLHSVAVSC